MYLLYFFADQKSTKKVFGKRKTRRRQYSYTYQKQTNGDGHAVIGLFVEKHRLPFGHISTLLRSSVASNIRLPHKFFTCMRRGCAPLLMELAECSVEQTKKCVSKERPQSRFVCKDNECL